jgi:hypothetical protein
MAEISFRFLVDVGREDEMITAIGCLLGHTRAKRGCLGCAGVWDPERVGWLHFHSDWLDERCLRLFLASDVVTAVLQILELSPQEPEVLIRTGAELEDGMATLRTVRLGSGEIPRPLRCVRRLTEDPDEITRRVRFSSQGGGHE